MLNMLMRQMSALRRAADGVAALEFGIIAPLLVVILIPVIDLGMGFYQKMEVENAAQAGAQYAMVHGWNSDAIQNAVTNATSLSSITASPQATKSCGCPSGTSVTSAACGANCTDGQQARTYVTVNAQSTYTPLVSYSGLGSSVTITAQAITRIQ